MKVAERIPEVRLRIIVVGPPRGVQFRLQEGRASLTPPTRTTESEVQFDFSLRVGPPRAGKPNFLGPAAQGPPATRFVYINSGGLAGQAATRWERRAKVPLRGITPEQLQAVQNGERLILEARIAGTARDGGPACASVRLLGDAWQIVSR